MDRARTVVTLGVLLGLCGSAPAHRVQYPKTEALEISPQSLTVHIEYLIPSAEESGLLSRLFDRDHSGTLSATERAALDAHLGRLATAFLVVELDGKSLPVGSTALERPGGGDLLAISLTLRFPLALAAGPHTLRLLDRHKDRSLAVPVRVTTAGVRLTTRLPPLPLLTAAEPLRLELVVSPKER
jgi:hypothetical protein